MSGLVSSSARARDGLALALIAAGAGAYVIAWRGMQALAEKRVIVPKGENLIPHWETYHNLSRLGIAGMAAGTLVAAWSFYRFRKVGTSPADAPPAPQP